MRWMTSLTPTSSASVELSVFIFCFFTEVDDGSLTEGHGAASVALKVWVDGEGCVYPPVDEAHVGDFEGEAEAGVSLEVSEEVSELRPVVFVGVFDACG